MLDALACTARSTPALVQSHASIAIDKNSQYVYVNCLGNKLKKKNTCHHCGDQAKEDESKGAREFQRGVENAWCQLRDDGGRYNGRQQR